MLQKNYFEEAVELARTMAQPETPTARERRLLNVARELARFLDYKTFGPNDRITLARNLSDALLPYDDIEPLHDVDRAEWRKRQDERAQANEPRRI